MSPGRFPSSSAGSGSSACRYLTGTFCAPHSFQSLRGGARPRCGESGHPPASPAIQPGFESERIGLKVTVQLANRGRIQPAMLPGVRLLTSVLKPKPGRLPGRPPEECAMGKPARKGGFPHDGRALALGELIHAAVSGPCRREAWRTLLAKRTHALADILVHEGQHLEGQALVEDGARLAEPVVERALGAAD